MKSLKKIIAILFIFAISFTAFAAPKVNYAELSKENTPENSVVMIFVGYGDFDLYQINPEYPANYCSVKQSSGCTTPLAPGSCYINCVPDITKTSWLGAPSITDSLPLAYLNAPQTDKFRRGVRISVPTEPGLYVYYVQMDIDAIKESGAIVIGKMTNDIEERKQSSMYRNAYLKIFKNCAKLYAGTDWEPLINEYVEEWTK